MKYQKSEGNWVTLTDLELPVTITSLNSRTVAPIKVKEQPEQHGPFAGKGGLFAPASPSMSTVTVFQNTVPGSTYIVGETVNSALDDLVLTVQGNNKAWRFVTLGVHLSTPGRTGKFLVRWRAYDQYIPGLGAGNTAFFGEMFDVGFYLERNQFPTTDSTFQVDIDFSQSPLMIVDDQVCYLAQQFRIPHVVGFPPAEDGEGAFSTEWNVFSDNGPQVGDSEDLFFFDQEPNGIYDETEADAFEIPGAGTYFFKTGVSSGPTTFLTPSSFTWLKGTLIEGNLAALWFDNGVYMRGRAGATTQAGDSPAQLSVTTFSPTSSPAGIRFDVDFKVNTPGLEVRLYLYNWLLQDYVQIYAGPAFTHDTTVSGVVAFPSLYVGPGSEITAKVSFFRTGPVIVWPWTVSIDQTQWVVTSST